MHNIYAVLVHEQPQCVLDLLRNLHYLDPDSPIVLYNGGQDASLLHGLPLESYGAVAHPRPRRLAWGRLHDFALDCMRFALQNLTFDTLTIVDSDQLAARANYPEFLAQHLADQPGVGMLSSLPQPQPRWTRVGPAAALWHEIDLWRPWLQQFGADESIFWTFWPSTVFTADAARDLVRLFDTDERLQANMDRTTVWATEEVLLPTITARLGYTIAANPCSYDFTKYRVPFTLRQIDAALARPDVYWLHPIPRRYDDRLRRRVRSRHGQYQSHQPIPTVFHGEVHMDTVLLTLPLLSRMKTIDGWLEEDEADLLIGAVTRAITTLTPACAVVEIGSYCGRSTVVLGSVVKALQPAVRVFAIDPHEGTVGAADRGLSQCRPSFTMFQRNITAAGLTEIVQAIQQYSYNVVWDQPISLLLIDGLHDYANVARDFHHFAPWIVAGGFVAFHDYADYYPGVQAFVNELLAAGEFQRVALVRSMILVQKTRPAVKVDAEDHQRVDTPTPRQSHAHPSDVVVPAPLAPQSVPQIIAQHGDPLVSCILPTANRRVFVRQAIQQFQQQDYPNRELIVLDDGTDLVADLMPDDIRIRYSRLEQRTILGTKRNLACAAASGSIIIHWDDDDWMAERRISYQVGALLNERADLSGLDTILYFDPMHEQAWQYTYRDGGRPWLAGNTLCYTKAFWQAHRFPPVQVGEDTRFVWSDRRAQIVRLPDPTFYVALIHSGNTSPKHTSDTRWRSYPVAAVHAILGPNYPEIWKPETMI